MDHQDITILYVDDEEINLFIFERSFQKTFKVITAMSGLEGLEKLDQNENIAAVISDMKMPAMNGVEFIIKARESHNNLVYFILTALTSNDEIEEAVNNKLISQLFTKPLNIEEITEAIYRSVPRN